MSSQLLHVFSKICHILLLSTTCPTLFNHPATTNNPSQMAAKEEVEYTNISFCEMNETDTDKAIGLIKDIINQHRKGVGSVLIVVFYCFFYILVPLCANHNSS